MGQWPNGSETVEDDYKGVIGASSWNETEKEKRCGQGES